MSASHRHTFDMIPWLVNGRIGDHERRAFDEHLHDCAECREELALQQRVYAAIENDKPRVDYAPGASLQKLRSRISADDEVDSRSDAVAPIAKAGRRHVMQWLVAAVVAEAIGIALLAAASLHHSQMSAVSITPPVYRTVTTTEVVPTTAA